MKSPERITIALDEETAGLFKKMKQDMGRLLQDYLTDTSNKRKKKILNP